MATSKTLTPTNVTIQIPEFTDQPDQRVNSNCIDKEADAINELHSTIKGSYDLGSDTIANIQTAIYTLVGNMGNGEQKTVVFTISTASSPFSAAAYIGQVMRISRTRFRVEASEAVYNTTKIIGRYKDGTWYWGTVPLILTKEFTMESAADNIRLENYGVSRGKFINAFVTSANNISCIPYAYSSYGHIRFVNSNTMAVASGTYSGFIVYYE